MHTFNLRKACNHFLSFITLVIVLVWVFPVIYVYLTSFKVEETVVPPTLIIKDFTLENYANVLTPDILFHIRNSFLVTVCSVLLSLLFGVPVAYRLVFGTMKSPDKLYFWFLTTFILPPVAVLIPTILLLRSLLLFDSLLGLIFIYTAIDIPIIIWLVRSFFADIPKEILEAAYIDGSTRFVSFIKIIFPLARVGIVAAALLTFVFIWNESFFAVNLTGSRANTLPVYMASFLTQEGLFWAKLSAIASIVTLPTIILGLFAQKSLIKGLTSGSVKG